MCGIGGLRRFGNELITEDQITMLLCTNEHRGNDASGVALQERDGTTHVLKLPVPAWNFTNTAEYRAFMGEFLTPETMIALVHTRAATQGDKRNPRNNHPCWNGHSAVVHNGMINNDGLLFNRMKMERVGEVDSDVLRAILDKHGMTKDGVKELGEVQGSCAIAAVSQDFPGKLILGRSGSPLVLASTAEMLVWASEKQSIQKAMKPIVMRFGFPMQPNRSDLTFITMNDASIYLLGELKEEEERGIRFFSAIEWSQQFKTCHYYQKPTYKVNENYYWKNQRYDRPMTEPDVLFCETCKEWRIKSEKNMHKAPWELKCMVCKSQFMPEPKEE